MAMVALSVLAAVVLLGLACGMAGSAQTRLKRSAVMLVRQRQGAQPRRGQRAVVAAVESVKRSERRTLPMIEQLAGRLLPRQSILRERMARAGLSLSIGGMLLIAVAVGAIAGGTALLLGRLPLVPAAAIGVAAAAALPHMTLGFLGSRRSNRFLSLFPDAIDLIVRGLKSGLPVTESIATVGREIAEPLGSEFRAISDGIRFGRPMDELLWETARRLQSQEFNFFVISLAIQQETGGNLAETLANLSDILRRRRQMRLKVKALSSEAKASAMILGCLPFVMYTIISFINPGYEDALLTDPRGNVMLGFAIGSLTLGCGIMAKMIRFEV
jgi:tight adherence protein B